jgi:hypothetical protein
VSFALEGYYRYGYCPYDLSLRGGFEDLSGSAGTRILLGANARTRVVSYSESFPLDGAFILGFGANVGDGPDAYYLPIGFSRAGGSPLKGPRRPSSPTSTRCWSRGSAAGTAVWTRLSASAWTCASARTGPSG